MNTEYTGSCYQMDRIKLCSCIRVMAFNSRRVGVAASHTRVAITSYDKHTVHVFNTVGRPQFVYERIRRPDPREVKYPHRVTLDAAGRVLVAD